MSMLFDDIFLGIFSIKSKEKRGKKVEFDDRSHVRFGNIDA